jgi:hypothetical protein
VPHVAKDPVEWAHAVAQMDSSIRSELQNSEFILQHRRAIQSDFRKCAEDAMLKTIFHTSEQRIDENQSVFASSGPGVSARTTAWCIN